MPLKLNSTGGGSVTLDVPSTGSALTVTVPALTGTIITTGDTGTITETMLATNSVGTNEIIASAVTPAKLSQPMTLMTANSSISGSTFVDFTGIPTWANRITVIFSGVSTNGSSNPIFRIGDSSGFLTSGYLGSCVSVNSTPGVATNSVGFILGTASTSAATSIRHGLLTLVNITGNIWVISGNLGSSEVGIIALVAGSATLTNALISIRITTVNGTDTFDAGTINVMYE